MSALYDRFRATATRLVGRFDQEGTRQVLRVVVAAPDPLQPPVTVQDYLTFPAVVRGISANILANDPNLSSTDLQVITDTTVYQPTVGDMVEVNGKARAVLRVDAIPAAGDPCAYRFYVR